MNAKLKLSCALIVSLCISLMCIAGTALVVSSEDALPDLVVTGIVTPESLYPDYRYTIGVTVKNIGGSEIATPFNVSLNVNETVIGNETINALSAGENLTVEFSWMPLSTGFYNLIAVADHENVISESDETNNNRTWDVRVVERVPIELLSPRGGEVWEGTENIEWNTTFWKNLTIDIDYSPNRGGRWSRIVSGTGDDGSYAWNTTDVSDGYDYLIRVMANSEDAYGEDISNKFTISNTGSAESWEGFHANAGFSMSTAPDSANLAWVSNEIGANPSSSVCVADGKVFVYCDDGKVKCLDDDSIGGVVLWEVDVGGGGLGSWATPVYSKGKIYMIGSGWVGLDNDTDGDPLPDEYKKAFVLSTIDAETGDATKKYYLVNKTDASGVPVNGGVLVAYGTQFFSTYDDGLYYRVGDAVDPPLAPPGMSYCYGAPAPSGWDWRFEVDGIAQSTPAAAFDSIYFGSYAGVGGGGALYRVNRGTGSEIWNQSLASGVCGSPTVVNGNVYLTTYGFYGTPSGTYAFDAMSGAPVWNKIWANNKRPSDSTPAYAPFDDGYVYVAGGGWADSPYVVCFNDSDGSIVWDNDKSNFDQWINDSSQHDDKPFGIGHWTNSPVVSIDGKVFVGKPAEGGVTDYTGLFCLDAKTGKERWHSDYGGSTVAIANGRVYTTGEGRVYAFGHEERPDLIPKDIVVVYPPAYEGLDNLINVTVENIGTEDAGDFDVSLGCGGVEIGITSISSLARGATANATFRWTPHVTGNYTLQATVNEDMRVNENLFNNRMNNDLTVLSTPQSDISVTSLTHSSPVLTGESCTISARIINYGAPASNFYVSLTADGELISTIPAELSYMESRIVSFIWEPFDPITYTLTVFADCENTTLESDETNNTMSIQVTAIAITKPRTPFIVGGYVSDADDNPCNGSWIRITNTATGEDRNAKNSSISNYYQLVITSDNVSDGDVLRFVVECGSESVAVKHTVTQDEVNAGGFYRDIRIGELPGDVNRDGEVTAADATIALRMAVRGEFSEEADVNGDRVVTSLDALMILQRATEAE